MSQSYRVTGMSCGGCTRSVENAIRQAAPNAQVSIDLATGTVTVDGADQDIIAQAVDEAGFGFEGPIASPAAP